MKLIWNCIVAIVKFLGWVIAALSILGFVYLLMVTLRGQSCSILHEIIGIVPVEPVMAETAKDSFGLYRDFVTTVTGMLALVVGAIGVGSYISFKKFKEEEQKVTDRRKQLEMHLKIEEARIVKGSDDLGSMAVVKIYNEAEALYPDYPLLYILRGEEFYLMGDDHYPAAKAEFKRALKKAPTSSRAWYGLGQTLYKMAIKDNGSCQCPEDVLETKEAAELKLKDFQYVAKDKDMIKEAIECMQNAFSHGFDEALTKYESGRMYETIQEHGAALKQYMESYQKTKSNHTTGLYYCSLWVRMNIGNLNNNVSELHEVIGILKNASYQNLYAGPLAYALLWFLYAKTGENDKAKEMLNERRPYAIKELFMTSDVACE